MCECVYVCVSACAWVCVSVCVVWVPGTELRTLYSVGTWSVVLFPSVS